MPCCSAPGRMRCTASATTSSTWTTSCSNVSSISMRDSSSRSSMVRPTRSASARMRSASRPTTSASSSSSRVSASRLSAPTGVLSSWLMLATKSRRTASSRRRSDTSSMSTTAPIDGSSPSSGHADRTIERCGGPYCSIVRRSEAPASAPRVSSSMLAVAIASVRRPLVYRLAAGVAVHDRACAVEDEDAEAERVDGASHRARPASIAASRVRRSRRHVLEMSVRICS